MEIIFVSRLNRGKKATEEWCGDWRAGRAFAKNTREGVEGWTDMFQVAM